MNEKVMIGKTVKKSRILWEIVSGIVCSFVFYYLFYALIKEMPYFQQTQYALECMEIALVFICVINWILGVALLGMKQVIIIDQENLYYYASHGFVQQIQNTIRILLNQQQICHLKITLKDIQYITLLYSDIYMGWGQKGHSILFNIMLTDGTMIKLHPDNLYFEKQNCLQGVEFLEKQGVEVKDPYQLKEALKDPHLRFAEYIEKVRDEHVS